MKRDALVALSLRTAGSLDVDAASSVRACVGPDAIVVTPAASLPPSREVGGGITTVAPAVAPRRSRGARSADSTSVTPTARVTIARDHGQSGERRGMRRAGGREH